jgi:monocyte-to-macrophage differentiation protein
VEEDMQHNNRKMNNTSVRMGSTESDECVIEKQQIEATEQKKKQYYVRCPCGLGHMHVMNHATEGEEYHPTALEEFANVITHLIPAILSITVLPKLFSTSVNTPRESLTAFIYGGCWTLLFTVSSMYHMTGLVFGKIHWMNSLFLKLDMTTIYAFIAASYTPWCLLIDVGSDNIYGRTMMTIVWMFALLGTMKNLVGLFPNFSSLYFYLAMGWFCACYILVLTYLQINSSLFPSVSLWAIGEIFIGGLLYNLGTVIYRMDGKLPFAHAIWHIFVFAAASVHMHAVIIYLMALE